MIPRYARPEMTALWSPEAKFRIWFEIEAHAADALAELGVIPKAAAKTIWEKGARPPVRCRAHRRDRARGQARRHRVPHPSRGIRRPGSALRASGHDFVRRARHLPGGAARARRRHPASRMSMLCSRRSSAAPSNTRHAVTIGRSHGIHAEPTTFGLKLAGFYAEFARARARLVAARAEIATCAISGAVGTFANIDPRGRRACRGQAWASRVEPVSTQVIPRDRHAAFFAALGVVASSLERLADRNPPSAAHRSAGGRGIFLARAEGLFRHAAQAQSGADAKTSPASRAWCAAM